MPQEHDVEAQSPLLETSSDAVQMKEERGSMGDAELDREIEELSRSINPNGSYGEGKRKSIPAYIIIRESPSTGSCSRIPCRVESYFLMTDTDCSCMGGSARLQRKITADRFEWMCNPLQQIHLLRAPFRICTPNFS